MLLAGYWALFQVVDMLSAAVGLWLDPATSWRLLPLDPLQRFCHQQLLSWIAIRTLAAVKCRVRRLEQVAENGKCQRDLMRRQPARISQANSTDLVREEPLWTPICQFAVAIDSFHVQPRRDACVALPAAVVPPQRFPS